MQEELGLDEIAQYKNLKELIKLKQEELTGISAEIEQLISANHPDYEIEFYTNQAQEIENEISELNENYKEYEGSDFEKITSLESEMETLLKECEELDENIITTTEELEYLKETNYSPTDPNKIYYKVINNLLARSLFKLLC